MKIGILGSGDVGQALGLGFARYGHQVMMGSRDAGQEKVRKWVGLAGQNASAGSFAEAAAFAELAVLATLWSGTEQAIALAGPERLAGKPVIDVTNPLDFSQGAPRLALGHSDSGGEQVQRWLRDARVVKAFNIVGHPHMVDPVFAGGPPDMFICGNDPGAKRSVTGLLEDFGWSVVDLGGIECARYLEPMAMIWILHYLNTGNGNHAFKLLRS
jgi:predicted dinucleotide-binding enzyme